jgi:hypothetical protein
VTSAFDGTSQDALVFSASTCLAARADFSLFGNQAAKYIRLFVVNCQVLISTKLANFGAGKITAFAALIHIVFIARFTFHKFIDSNLYWVAAINFI